MPPIEEGAPRQEPAASQPSEPNGDEDWKAKYEALLGHSRAVSYTHLDVYKRQPRHWVTQGRGAGNLVEEVRETARLAGYDPLDWQADVLGVWSAFDERGRWVHRRNGA